MYAFDERYDIVWFFRLSSIKRAWRKVGPGFCSLLNLFFGGFSRSRFTSVAEKKKTGDEEHCACAFQSRLGCATSWKAIYMLSKPYHASSFKWCYLLALSLSCWLYATSWRMLACFRSVSWHCLIFFKYCPQIASAGRQTLSIDSRVMFFSVASTDRMSSCHASPKKTGNRRKLAHVHSRVA